MKIIFKKWEVKESLWSIATFSFLLIAVLPIAKLRSFAQFNFEFRNLPFYALLLLCLLFGFLLGLPALIERWDKSRRFYWSKFFIQGLPALVLATPYILIMDLLNINGLSTQYIPWFNLQNYSYNGYVYFLSAVWLGKTLVDSIKGYSPYDKDKENLSAEH